MAARTYIGAASSGVSDEQRAVALRALQGAALSLDSASEQLGVVGFSDERVLLKGYADHLMGMAERVRGLPKEPSEVDALYAAVGAVHPQFRERLRALIRERVG